MPPRINEASKKKYIQKLEDLYGDVYDYSLSNYTSYMGKIKIRHIKTQLIFEQNYNSHLEGKSSSSLEFNFIKFVEKCNLKFDSRFKYSDYVGYNKKVTIHDTLLDRTYSQIAQEHYEEESIPRCYKEYLSGFNVFKEKATEIHNGIFEYVNYDWENRKVSFIHKESGELYTQRIYEHVNGSLPLGFLKSNLSKGELRLRNEVCKLFDPNLIVFNKRPSFLNGKELDIFIPSLNLAFEYNGTVCHHSNFKIADQFARNKAKPKDYHLNKFQDCLNNGVKLIHIFDFETYDLKSLVELYLNSELKVVENKPYYLNKRLKFLTNFSEKSTFVVYKPILSFNQPPSHS